MSDLNKFVQAPKLYLSGSGISSTATSIQVEQLVKPGTTTNVTMTDFGDTGYGVLEPGTDREENFSFTGITFDGDNRATFTTVTRGLDFVSPYTENAALKHQHAGGTVAYISNTAPFYNELSSKDNDETVTGIWTFTSTATPRYDAHPTFTDDKELIDKKYADDLAIAGAPDGAEAVKGIYEAATQTEVDQGDDTGTTTAPTVVRPSKLATVIQKGSYVYAADAGANDTYAVTLVPALAAYVAGQAVNFTPNTSNTGASTINVNALGAKNIKKYCNGAISDTESNDLIATMPCHLIYDGTQFILQTTPATSLTSAAAYEAQQFFGSTGITGAEAETLSDGSEASTLHVHRVIGSLTKSASDVTVTNTVVETTLITYSVPANTLGTSKAIKVEAPITDLDVINDTNLTIRLKYGGTTLATAVIGNQDTAAASSSFTDWSGKIEAFLFGTGATNTQEGSISIFASGSLTVPNIGYETSLFDVAVGTAAENSTGALNLVITAQWSTTSASDSITIPHYFIY